jgi:hypothetical protein
VQVADDLEEEYEHLLGPSLCLLHLVPHDGHTVLDGALLPLDGKTVVMDCGRPRRQGRTSVEGLGQRSSSGDLKSKPQRPRGRARRQRLAWAASAMGDLGDERPWRPHGRAAELGGLTSGRCRGQTLTNDSGPVRVGEMHRGERQCIFAHPLSSKVKCFTDLTRLLDEELAMHSDFREPFFRLPVLVEVSLSTQIITTGAEVPGRVGEFLTSGFHWSVKK